MQQGNNIFSKRNVLVAGSVGACLVGAGFIYYSYQQKKLYQELWDMAPVSVDEGGKGDKSDLDNAPFWQASYLNTPGISPTSLDYTTAKEYAKQIYDAKTGLIGNHQENVIAIFNKLRNRTDVAKIANLFSAMYNTSTQSTGTMFDYLKSFMNPKLGHDYMTDLYKVVLKLPA